MATKKSRKWDTKKCRVGLAKKDIEKIISLSSDYDEQSFLFCLFMFAKNYDEHAQFMYLSRNTVLKFQGTHERTYSKFMRNAIDNNLFTLRSTHSTYYHTSRIYRFNYDFDDNGFMTYKTLGSALLHIYNTDLPAYYDSRTINKIKKNQ